MYPQPPQPYELKLTGAEKFWYYAGCILGLGIPYFMKIYRKKAMIEVLNQQALLARWQQLPPGPPAPGMIPPQPPAQG